MAAGTEPEGATPMSLAEFATSAADVPAGLLKGVVQGSIGLPGDIISLVRGVYDLGRSGGDVDAFLGGLEKATGLPTTEDVKKFFDETLGIPLVPAGASERRREAAKIPEFVGELGGAGTTAIEGTKAAVRGINVGAMAVADKAVQAITGNPQATAMGALEAAGQMAPLSRIFSPEQAKKVVQGTKVVDEFGNPMVMYHGTQRAPTGIDEFGSESGYAGQKTAGLSWFTSSPQTASGYANWVEGAGNPTVYPVYLSIKNPASINDYLKAVDEINKSVKGKNFVDADPEIGMYDKRVVEKLKDKGFDGVSWTDAEYTGQTGFATDKDVTALPFSSKQIKSATSDPAFAGLLEPEAAQKATKKPTKRMTKRGQAPAQGAK
jgi:hypothetical protein